MIRRHSLAAAATLAVLACSPSGEKGFPGSAASRPPSLQEICGRLVSPHPVVVAAAPSWQPTADGTRWRFPQSATFAILVTEQPEEPLEMSLAVEVGDASFVRFRFDGTWMERGWVQHVRDGVLLEVPAERLTTGVHALTVVRTEVRSTREKTPPLLLGEIAWSLGGVRRHLDPRQVYRQYAIARFLLHGVTGARTSEWLGGVLFDGPGSVRASIAERDPGELRTTVQNISSEPATFGIRAGSTTIQEKVAPYAKAALALPLDGIEHSLELAVAGPTAGVFLWGAPRIEPGSRTGERHPIVLITLDTTRRDVVPPYGGSRDVMPHLAELADGATIYERAVTTAPWTLPSHASMLTGLYPSHHLAGVTLQELPARRTTVAELLREHGYLTAGFAGGFFCSSKFGLSQGFMVYHDPPDWEIRGDRLTDLVLELLDDSRHGLPFLFINYFDAHEPYQAPEAFRSLVLADRLSAGRGFPPPWDAIIAARPGAWVEAVTEDVPYPAEALRALRAEYRAEVAFVDHQLGRVLTALRRRGLYDAAMIVVVADHGELLGENHLIGHGGRLDPELIEVPLLIKFPGQHRQRRVSDLVSVVDLYPTMLAAAGIEVPASDGVPLGSTGDRDLVSRSLVFAEEHELGIHRPVGRLRLDAHVYSVEALWRRSVAWSTGEDCFERRGRRWRGLDCPTESSTMSLIAERLVPPELLEGGELVDLTDQDMERLEALGYVH
jgi:hypothetical protein